MPNAQSPLPDYAQRVRAGFARQTVMLTIGATLTVVEPGHVAIELPYRADLGQQHGFVHAGIITTIVDSACGFAAYSLMPVDAEVLTVEFKVNFMAPARGDRFIASGKVVKSGRTLTVCAGEVIAVQADGTSTTIALMQATMMAVTLKG